MDKNSGTPISQLDDNALQIHALGMAYREAERRREEAEGQLEELKTRCRAAERKAEKLSREYRDLVEQMKEMTKAYQSVMKKNAALAAGMRHQAAELEKLRNPPREENPEGGVNP